MEIKENLFDESRKGRCKVLIVTPQNLQFKEPLKLDCGRELQKVNLRYETVGTLNADASNAILFTHALSGDAHLCGYHTEEDKKPGWWDDMVGPGKYVDTDKYFVICSNILGGCAGSTGPRSVDPVTGNPYNLTFPVLTIRDMVRAQHRLMEHFGIQKFLAIIGGSMGGMQALEWAVTYPDAADSIFAIATTSQLSSQGIAFDWVSREAIMGDPHFANGNYLADHAPEQGLATARMLAHITYLSDESMNRKFGRSLQDSDHYRFGFQRDFQVESYLAHQGRRFVERFDADSYLYITRAIDYFDLAARTGGDLAAALNAARANFLVVSFSSDWLFPTEQSKKLVKALLKARKKVSFCEIQSSYGHDAFLLEVDTLGGMMRDFLANRMEAQK